MADEKKHANDEYINPGSRTAAPPVPPEVFLDQLAEEKAEAQGERRGRRGALRARRAPPGRPQEGRGEVTRRAAAFDETKEQLEERARVAGIEGFSKLDKEGLADALVEHYKDHPPPVPRLG